MYIPREIFFLVGAVLFSVWVKNFFAGEEMGFVLQGILAILAVLFLIIVFPVGVIAVMVLGFHQDMGTVLFVVGLFVVAAIVWPKTGAYLEKKFVSQSGGTVGSKKNIRIK